MHQDKVSGKRIMGMTPQNSIATMVASKPHALWDVPDSWNLAQAATVPVAYATAYDALVVRGRLQPHHRVLIHSASGAVGLAATRICLNRCCEVRLCSHVYSQLLAYWQVQVTMVVKVSRQLGGIMQEVHSCDQINFL